MVSTWTKVSSCLETFHVLLCFGRDCGIVSVWDQCGRYLFPMLQIQTICSADAFEDTWFIFLVGCSSSAKKNEIFGERKGISEMVMKTWLDYLPYTKSDNLTVWNSYFIMCYLWDISANIVFIIYSSITAIFVKLATNDTFFLHISGQNSLILQGKTVLWCNLPSSYSTDIEKRDETLCPRARKTFVDVQQHSKYNSKH